MYQSSTVERIQEVMEHTTVDVGALLDAGDGAIVTLVAGDTRLVVHRSALVSRSPVFAAMFRHDTLEASSGQVAVPDVEGPVLRQLLGYMYSLQAPQLPSMAPQLLAAADKYGVSALKGLCEWQLAAQLSVETAATAAVLAVRHSCTSLRQAAVNFIKDHFVQVMATQGWADVVQNWPKEVIEVSRLMSEPPTETSAPAPGGSGTAPGSQPQPEPRGDRRQTAGSAADQPHAAAVSRLQSLSADEKGERLIQAAKEGAVEELRSLLAAGADVGAKDGNRYTALYWAAQNGHEEAARRLLGNGAEVDGRNDRQSTPLHAAAESGRTAVVRLLLASSAYHSARNQYGKTPLHYAAQHGHAEAAAALLEAGADRAARTNKGKTPLDLARQNNQQQLVDALT